jgi:hypothetical protein
VEVTNEDLGRDYLHAMENARQRYSTLRAIESSHTPVQAESSGTIAGAFRVLVDRIQAWRFEESDPRKERDSSAWSRACGAPSGRLDHDCMRYICSGRYMNHTGKL